MAKGYTSIFSTVSSKENNFYDFLFPSLDKEALPKEVYSERKKIVLYFMS